MAVVSTIAIKLEAQTAALKKGFEQANNATKKFARETKSALDVIKFTAILQGVEQMTRVLRMGFDAVINSANRVANLGDIADRIGINVERLQELNLVTSQFGGSAQVMQTALQRLGRRTAEAAATNNAFAKQLRELGVDVREMARMPLDRQFLRMADAVGRLATVGEKNALIMKAMDTEGVALSDTLRQGADEIQRMMKGLRDNGIILEEQVRNAQALAAQWHLVNEQWKAAKDTLFLELAPALIKVTEWMTKLSKAVNDLYLSWQDLVYRLAGFGWAPRPLGAPRRPPEAPGAATGLGAFAPIEPPRPPGAVTSTTTAGFSALQEGRRRAKAREKFEFAMLGKMDELIAAVEASRVTYTPVRITA